MPEPANALISKDAAEVPLVTLFVMAYRQESTVREAIQGAFAQTYSPLEIILSDDASPDATFAVMQEMAAAYDGPHRVRLNRNPENLGILAHTNRLAAMASGKLLVNAAGDDVSEPDRVERLVRPWKEGGGRIKAVHSALREIGPDGRPLGIRRPPDCIVLWKQADPFVILREQANCTGAAAAWSRELFERFGPLPEDRRGVEDTPLFFRAALLGDIAYIDAPLVRYRLDGLSGVPQESRGWRHLYGFRIKRKEWWLLSHRSFLRDLARIETPRKTEMEALCRQRIEETEFELRLVRGTRLSRLTSLPRAAWLSLSRRKRVFLVENLKFLFEEIYMSYLDRRQGRAPAAPAARARDGAGAS